MDSLVSTDWLERHLGDPDLVVLDASRHLPAANRDPRAEYEKAHIPGARFLDLASFSDTQSSVPAALPTPDQVAQRLGELGVKQGDRIVLYDDSAVKTSARAWFALTRCAISPVAILDGGLGKWRGEGRMLESGKADFAKAKWPNLVAAPLVASKQDVLDLLARADHDHKDADILDARGADRVFGSGIDPVHGGQNGRIPGSLNLPFGEVFTADGTFRPRADLRALLQKAGIALDRRVITTCGSGVTASVLLFALHLAGHDDAALYDGSWQEWEADPHTPKAQGPAEQA